MKNILLPTALLVVLSTNLYAQTDTTSTVASGSSKSSFLSSADWVQDQTTISFGEKRKKKNCFSGIRIVLEPQLGVLLQNGKNQLEANTFDDLSKIAFETNLWKGWVSFQVGLIYPSTVGFDSKSDIVKNSHLQSGDAKVSINYGTTFGLTFIDGVISVGYGTVFLDSRDFVANYDGSTTKTFMYFNIQPATAIKDLIKTFK
jgi:hypothetical protein